MFGLKEKQIHMIIIVLLVISIIALSVYLFKQMKKAKAAKEAKKIADEAAKKEVKPPGAEYYRYKLDAGTAANLF